MCCSGLVISFDCSTTMPINSHLLFQNGIEVPLSLHIEYMELPIGPLPWNVCCACKTVHEPGQVMNFPGCTYDQGRFSPLCLFCLDLHIKAFHSDNQYSAWKSRRQYIVLAPPAPRTRSPTPETPPPTKRPRRKRDVFKPRPRWKRDVLRPDESDNVVQSEWNLAAIIVCNLGLLERPSLCKCDIGHFGLKTLLKKQCMLPCSWGTLPNWRKRVWKSSRLSSNGQHTLN